MYTSSCGPQSPNYIGASTTTLLGLTKVCRWLCVDGSYLQVPLEASAVCRQLSLVYRLRRFVLRGVGVLVGIILLVRLEVGVDQTELRELPEDDDGKEDDGQLCLELADSLILQDDKDE